MGLWNPPGDAEQQAHREVGDADRVPARRVEYRNSPFGSRLDIDVRLGTAARAGNNSEGFGGVHNRRGDALVADDENRDVLD
jgi:hypothetical protein